MSSKKIWYSDNFQPLLWGYYWFGSWILLALKLTIRIIARGDMVGIKSERGGSWKNFAKLIIWTLCELNERSLLLRFKMVCYVLLYNFLLDLYSFCWLNKVFALIRFEFICDSLYGLARSLGINAKESLHELRFPNIYIIPHIIYFIVPLSIIIVLAIKAVGFQRSDKPKLRRIMVIS